MLTALSPIALSATTFTRPPAHPTAVITSPHSDLGLRAIPARVAFGAKARRVRQTTQPSQSAPILPPTPTVAEIMRGLEIISPIAVSRTQAREWVEQTIEAHKQAKRNKLLNENHTGEYYASFVLLADNKTSDVGMNIELFSDTTFCAERGAFLGALNKLASSMPDPDTTRGQSPALLHRVRAERKVKTVILSSALPMGSEFLTPCTECLAWMGSQHFFAPETQIVALRYDTGKKHWQLVMRQLRELLPLMGRHHASLSSRPIQQLPIDVSPEASAVLNTTAYRDWKANPPWVPMLQAAKKRFERNYTVKRPEKNSAASVAFNYGDPVVRGRLDFKRRFPERPDIVATVAGIQEIADRRRSQSPFQDIKIKGIAYYGNDDQTPSLSSLAKLAVFESGGKNILLATIDDHRIKVRTLGNYIADFFVTSDVSKRQGRTSPGV